MNNPKTEILDKAKREQEMSENSWVELVVIFVAGILVVLIAAWIGKIASGQLNIFGF